MPKKIKCVCYQQAIKEAVHRDGYATAGSETVVIDKNDRCAGCGKKTYKKTSTIKMPYA